MTTTPENFVMCVRFDPDVVLDSLLDEVPMLWLDACALGGAEPTEEPSITITYHDEFGPCLAAVALAVRTVAA